MPSRDVHPFMGPTSYACVGFKTQDVWRRLCHRKQPIRLALVKMVFTTNYSMTVVRRRRRGMLLG